MARPRGKDKRKKKIGATHRTPRRSRKTQGRGGGRACAPACRGRRAAGRFRRARLASRSRFDLSRPQDGRRRCRGGGNKQRASSTRVWLQTDAARPPHQICRRVTEVAWRIRALRDQASCHPGEGRRCCHAELRGCCWRPCTWSGFTGFWLKPNPDHEGAQLAV